jgi:hypothetical protein
MRKAIVFALVAAVAAPVLAVADEPSATDKQNAEKQCRALRDGMGKTAFKQLYGTNKNRSNAFGKCVSKKAKDEQAERAAAKSNAAKQCKAEQEDANFAANHDGKSFDQFYGTGKNGKNAFGKCVSQKARQNKQKADDADKKHDQEVVNAARSCRAEQKDPHFADSHQGKTFSDFYGTNRNKRNAFGKCVSQKVHAQHQQS